MKRFAPLLLLLAACHAAAQPAASRAVPSGAGDAGNAGFTEVFRWRSINGSARQLSISPNGAVLALGRDGEAWQWKGGGQWGRLPGSFQALALDTANVPWGIVADGRILRYQGSYWTELPGRAIAIAGGPDGTVWTVQPDGQPARWSARERAWQAQSAPARLRRLAIAPDGEPWAVAESGRILRRAGETWETLPGGLLAADISIGPEGAVFAVGVDRTLRRWRDFDQRWERLHDSAEAAAVGPNGQPWIVTAQGRILASALFDALPDSRVNTTSVAAANAAAEAARSGSPAGSAALPGASAGNGPQVVGQPGIGSGAPSGRRSDPLDYRKVEGKAKQIAIGADGSVFIVAQDNTLARWSNTRNAFLTFPGQLLRIAVSPEGNPWGLNATGDVFRHDGAAWKQVLNIKAQDIAIGFDGTVVVADQQTFLQRYDAAKDAFARLPANADGVPPMGVRVAVTPAGKPWVITAEGFVARCEKSGCQHLPVLARSLGIGPEGSLLIVDGERILRRWNSREESFERIDGIPDLADSLAVGPHGKPWLLSTAAEIWATEFFRRDERRDITTVAVTDARFKAGETTGGPAPIPVFRFTVGVAFQKLAEFVPPFLEFGFDSATYQMAINPITGRATLINATGRFFNYEEASRRLVLDTTITAAPFSGGYEDVQSFVIGKDGSYWVSTNRGVNAEIWLCRQKQWVSVPGNWGAPIPFMQMTLTEAADGSIYANGVDGQLYRYNTASKSFVRMTLPLPNGEISLVAITPDGRFWVGSEGSLAPGIYERVGSAWQMRLPGAVFLDECKMGAYACLAIGGDGSVYTHDTSSWSDYRLQRWNPNAKTWSQFSVAPNLVGKGTYAVGPDGRPWVIQRDLGGSGPGLYRAR